LILWVLTAFCTAAIAFWWGGWEWAVMLFASLLLNRQHLKNPLAILSHTIISLLWLLYFVATGDRRLYFPFTIQLAVQSITIEPSNRSRFAAAAIIGLFSAIRLIQNASLIVLTVELVVSAVAIGIPGYLSAIGIRSPFRRLILAGLGSLLAFAGLAF
jgi:hypothetical protein